MTVVLLSPRFVLPHQRQIQHSPTELPSFYQVESALDPPSCLAGLEAGLQAGIGGVVFFSPTHHCQRRIKMKCFCCWGVEVLAEKDCWGIAHFASQITGAWGGGGGWRGRWGQALEGVLKSDEREQEDH